MAKRRTRTVYRDSKTGRFVKRSTWKRSKAKGGKRYKRERVKAPKRKPPIPPPPPPPKKQFREYQVTLNLMSPKSDTQPTVDFIVVAPIGTTKDELTTLIAEEEPWVTKLVLLKTTVIPGPMTNGPASVTYRLTTKIDSE